MFSLLKKQREKEKRDVCPNALYNINERDGETEARREMHKVISQNRGEYRFSTKMKNMLKTGRERCHLGRGDNPRNPEISFF